MSSNRAKAAHAAVFESTGLRDRNRPPRSQKLDDCQTTRKPACRMLYHSRDTAQR